MSKSFQNKNDVSSSGFEETGSEESSNQGLEKTWGIADILHSCTNYKELKIKKEINAPLIDSDEEVFFLRIPKYVNPYDLKNTKFSLTKKSKVKTNSGIYRITPFSSETKPQLFISPHGLKKITPISTLQLEKYVETEIDVDETAEKDEVKPLPQGLTVRHTVFGAEYENKIDLEEEIQIKLQQALQRFDEKKVNPKNPKKKKKIEAAVENEEYEDKSLLISQIMEEKLKSKKIIRAEKNIVQEISSVNRCGHSDDQTSATDNAERRKKKKSKKHKDKDKSIEIKQELDDSYYSQQIVTSEVEYREKKKNKKDKKESKEIKQENDSVFSQEYVTNSEEYTEKKKHKKHKHKSIEIKQEYDDSFIAPPKKKKLSILSSTVIKECSPDFKPDISIIKNEMVDMSGNQ